jgi:DNA-binding FrmR family transcriptional regulator
MGKERDRSGGAAPATAPPARRVQRGLQPGMAALSRAIGNRALGNLLQRDPTATKDTILKPTSLAVSREEVEAAEAWVRYMAERGVTARPTLGYPERYRPFLASFNDAVFGAQDEKAKKPVSDSRFFLKTLRQLHDELIGTKDYKVFELAELALQRAAANARHEGGEAAFDVLGGTQLDYARTLLVIQSRADEELAGAKEMGYQIPERLAKLGGEASARYEKARKGWKGGAPGPDTYITPTDEAELVKFRDAALETISSMHAKRAADLARYHRAEAEALEAAAEKHLTELRAIMADRRRALFMAGKKGDLTKLREAAGQVTGVVDEMKDAAKKVTERVDQLNAVAEAITKSGQKLVNLPDLPKGLSGLVGVSDKLKSANAKLGKIMDVLDLVGPSKTSLDEGLKYLKGIDMALDHFSGKMGNPIFAVYVNSYLRPCIQNCVAQLGKIAGIISAQNRSLIEAGEARFITNWHTEPGGEGAYLFLAQVFKMGGAAAPNDEAWTYLKENDDDLEAAVGEAMPSDRRMIGPWASRNRFALWESFYGSTRPPR